MPTVLIMAGWRLFFYANEKRVRRFRRGEPDHVEWIRCRVWLEVAGGRLPISDVLSMQGTSLRPHQRAQKRAFELPY